MELKVGDRIELVSMGDDPSPIEPGTRGTVNWNGGVVRLGVSTPYTQIGVAWDNGRTLGLAIPPDVVRVVRSEESKRTAVDESDARRIEHFGEGG